MTRIDGDDGLVSSKTGSTSAAEFHLDKVESTNRELLLIQDLSIAFPSDSGMFFATNKVNLTVGVGDVVGLVGESGSGKSVTCRSIIRLVPHPGEIVSGSIMFKGRDMLGVSTRDLRRIRSSEISMIFQDPTNCLNPVFTIGQEIIAILSQAGGLSPGDARRRGVELFERVGIPDAERRMDSYPHELSGGQRQRVMIAFAIANRPSLLLADEPTTALDVTIQAQILRLLLELRSEIGMSIILVSHDMGVIAHTCNKVVVMYGGHIVESGSVRDVLKRPKHPYTKALLSAVPRLKLESNESALASIMGSPPDLSELPPGCPFGPRCEFATEECSQVSMSLEEVGPGHWSACPFVRGK